MKGSKAHIIPSLLLALLLLFGNAPKEAVHLFANHKDTIHAAHKDGELSFEPEHHHCDFLSYALPLFVAAVPLPIHFSEEKLYAQEHEEYQSSVFCKEEGQTSLRGPPVMG